MITLKLLLVGICHDLHELIDHHLRQIDHSGKLIIEYETSTMKSIAFEYARTFDLIIVDTTHDVYTPPINYAYREIASEKLKVILVGENADYSHVRSLFLSGIYDYWLKPFDSTLIGETLGKLLESSLETFNAPELRQKIIHAIEGLGTLNPYEYDLYYAHMVQPKLEKDMRYLNFYNIILDLIEPVSFDPMKLDKKKVAALCTQWILENKNPHNAMYIALKQIGKIYKEIFHPQVHSKIVRKSIYEVLSPKQYHKSVKYIADTLYVNQSHLSYTFKKHTGISLSEYIKQIKIYGSMWMLIQEEYSFDDILNILEYKDEQYFLKIFKEKTGTVPSVFRKSKLKYPMQL